MPWYGRELGTTDCFGNVAQRRAYMPPARAFDARAPQGVGSLAARPRCTRTYRSVAQISHCRGWRRHELHDKRPRTRRRHLVSVRLPRAVISYNCILQNFKPPAAITSQARRAIVSESETGQPIAKETYNSAEGHFPCALSPSINATAVMSLRPAPCQPMRTDAHRAQQQHSVTDEQSCNKPYRFNVVVEIST